MYYTVKEDCIAPGTSNINRCEEYLSTSTMRTIIPSRRNSLQNVDADALNAWVNGVGNDHNVGMIMVDDEFALFEVKRYISSSASHQHVSR